MKYSHKNKRHQLSKCKQIQEAAEVYFSQCSVSFVAPNSASPYSGSSRCPGHRTNIYCAIPPRGPRQVQPQRQQQQCGRKRKAAEPTDRPTETEEKVGRKEGNSRGVL